MLYVMGALPPRTLKPLVTREPTRRFPMAGVDGRDISGPSRKRVFASLLLVREGRLLTVGTDPRSIARLTAEGDAERFTCRYRAAMPATTGAAIDVPLAAAVPASMQSPFAQSGGQT
jgi:hypothetical protein